MSQPIQVDELTTLRQTVAELTQKNATRKQRITELETQLATANTATQTAQASLHEIQITHPMQVLAESISPTPELFLSELSRVGYSVVLTDGKLTLMSGDKPVEGVDVTVESLRKHLLSDDAKHKNFGAIIIASRASGGGAIGSSHGMAATEQVQQPNKPKLNLGLR